jgi:hypothetical protein
VIGRIFFLQSSPREYHSKAGSARLCVVCAVICSSHLTAQHLENTSASVISGSTPVCRKPLETVNAECEESGLSWLVVRDVIVLSEGLMKMQT